MRRYLLETNILSQIIKQPQSAVVEKVANLERGEFFSSVIVACELRYGVEKKGSAQLTARVELLLNEIDILPLEYESVNQHYASLRVFL